MVQQMDSWQRLSDVPPVEFTRARDALAKELRAAGKDEEAKRVAALRKPSAALWTVNQLGRRAPKQVGALIDAAEKLKRAHRQGDADALRAAMQEQRDALRELERAAGEAAAQIGAKASLELMRRVQTTAQSAAAAQPEALREGALEAELEPAGFETLIGTEIGAPHRPREAKRDAAEERKDREHAARELKRAEHDADELASKAMRLEQAAASAQEAAAEARRAADEARRAANEAQARAQKLRRV